MLFLQRLHHLKRFLAALRAGRAYGLRQKFFLSFTGLICVLTMALLLIVEHRQRASIVRQMEKRGEAIATHLAAVSTNALLTYNFVALEQNAEQISRGRDVLYAIILDREGRVAAYSGQDDKQGRILEDTVSQRAAQAQTLVLQHIPARLEGPEHYDIAVPVMVPGGGEKWGTVRVGLSLQDMHADIAQTRQHVLVLGVLGVVLSTAVAAWLSRRIIAPLQTLTAGTIAVARGELHHTITVSTHDEIATLAANFNHMTAELRTHLLALEESNYQLDHKVLELSHLANYNANILASMTSGLLTLDLEGRIATLNTMATAITGIPHATVQGLSYQEVFADNPSFVQVLDTSRHHRTPLTVPRLELRRPHGSSVPLALRTAMLQDQEAQVVGLLAIFEDLSPLQALEQRLQRADRLAALGQMAAGVAHEIKNPLASIRTFAQLVSRKHHDSRFVEKFDRIVPQELDRINFIVEELLELAKPAQLHCTPVAVSRLLQRVLDLYSERLVQQHIQLYTEFAVPLPALMGDAERLYRSFANIILNAIEAMPHGGDLTVHCHTLPLASAPLALRHDSERTPPPSTPEGMSLALEATDVAVVIVVQDTGVGIPVDQLDAVFTPFWTTKPKGTGLGLALTHKIIEEHRGTIHLASTAHQGTVVTIQLPSTSTHADTSAHISGQFA